MTEGNLFSIVEDHNEDDENAYEKLVGEGKKFSDNEALAKGKIHADRLIEKQQQELAEMRQELQNRLALEEVVTRLRSSNPPVNPNEGNPPPENPPVDPSKPNSENIEEIVQKLLSETESKRTAAENVKAVNAKLNEVWGENASKELNKISRQLGLTLGELEAQAAKNPNVFFRLVGIDNSTSKVVPGGTGVPRNTVNIPSSNSNVRDQKYYAELKRTNPKLYFETKTQVQMHKDALAMGEAFFNNSN